MHSPALQRIREDFLDACRTQHSTTRPAFQLRVELGRLEDDSAADRTRAKLERIAAPLHGTVVGLSLYHNPVCPSEHVPSLGWLIEERDFGA